MLVATLLSPRCNFHLMALFFRVRPLRSRKDLFEKRFWIAENSVCDVHKKGKVSMGIL